MQKAHYVYIVECKYGTFYTGYTCDIRERVKKHNEGRGAKYLRGRRPVKLVWSKEYGNRQSALKAENRIKSLSRGQKELLVREEGGLKV